MNTLLSPLLSLLLLPAGAANVQPGSPREDSRAEAHADSRTADTQPVDFDTQIEPLLTRYGCNAGSCHGAAAGRGGLSLSLYGSVPDRDYEALVLQLEGRRINLSQPDESLLFLKATESIPHGGGPRFDIDGEAARLLLTWVRQGTPRTSHRQLQSLHVAPGKLRLSSPGDTARITVQARFSDGSSEDVTTWSVLAAEDSSALTVTPAGDVTVSRPGRHLLTVRYLDQLIPVEVLLPFGTLNPADPPRPPDAVAGSSRAAASDPGATPGADAAADRLSGAAAGPGSRRALWPGRDNPVDRAIQRRLLELRLPVAADASPAAFLRRASLRLTGRLPDPELLDRFSVACAASPSDHPDNSTQQLFAARRKLIEELLASQAFNDFWTFQFVRLLKVRSQLQQGASAKTTQDWLRGWIAEDRPLDDLAREMILATGDVRTNGATAFYLAAGDARTQAEFTSELFLGVRLRCANCHDHPLDQWTQDDYHGLAAIFAPVRRGASITVGISGSVVHPRTGTPARRKLPAGRFLDRQEDGLRAFADWLTSSDNAWFDRAMANRIWKLLMGRGLVEPVDDLRSSNAATHPRLLTDLAAEFVRGGRRLKPLIRTICFSRTFGRSSTPVRNGPRDDQFYSHALAVPLEPEILIDAIADVTGVPGSFPKTLSADGRAVNLIGRDVASSTLDVLGRCPLDGECAAPGARAETLPRALLLINGGFLNDQLGASSGTLSRLLESGASHQELVRTYYRQALTREPAGEETAFWVAQFQQAGNQSQRRIIAEDFLWGLLTCQEFTTCR